LFQNNDFFADLNTLLSDENTMVVSNTIAAINEIQMKYKNSIIKLDYSRISKLIVIMADTNEWGQI